MADQFTGFLEYLQDNLAYLARLTLDHLQLTLIALVIGTALGISLGVLAYLVAPVRLPIVATAGIILTIPSLALYSLFVSFLGLGAAPVILALVLYSLLPIVRNTLTGLVGVDPAIVEAAKGQGMSSWMRLVRVQLPIAWPVILTGIRVSAVILVGIAALGAIVNGPGLGQLILDGLRRVGTPVALNMALAGTLGVVLLGLLLDLAFIALTRFTTSRGIRV